MVDVAKFSNDMPVVAYFSSKNFIELLLVTIAIYCFSKTLI